MKRRLPLLALTLALAGCGVSQSPQAPGDALDRRNAKSDAAEAAEAARNSQAGTDAADARGEAKAEAAMDRFDAMENAGNAAKD